MAGLIDIVKEMADQIRNVLAGTDMDVQVEPRMVIVPTPLTIDIYPGDTFRDGPSAAFDDNGGYLFTVRARINTPDFDAAYDVLMALLDDDNPLCLAQALLDEPTLNGQASDVDVRDATGLRAYERIDSSGADLGFQFTALVLPAAS